MACGETTGRIAFDLPTGCGKTQSVIAWCQAVYQMQTGHSAVIATSKVEELCNIKRKLMAKGMPEDSIGLIHSKQHSDQIAAEWEQTHDHSVLKQPGRSGV
jgi:superfamily II DNA or RNA helicase